MNRMTKEYTNGEITVIWKPDTCIHSTICWKGLIEVFNPRKRPWIDMKGADTEKIIEQVSKCPSGAISYYRNEDKKDIQEQTTSSVVEVLPSGPLLVYGNLTVKHTDGSEKKTSKVTAFCRCGHSGTKPYCDGSHLRNGFKDGN